MSKELLLSVLAINRLGVVQDPKDFCDSVASVAKNL
jgi:hypothetical protein